MSSGRGNGEGAVPDARYLELLDEAQAALEAGESVEALELAQQAMARDPMLADGHLVAGLALLELGHHRQAYAAFAEASSLRPADPEIATYEAATRFVLGDEQGAEVTLRRALAAEPELADACYWLSLVVERRGDYVEADQLLLRAAAIDPARYHPPFRIDRGELEEALRDILESLPERVRAAVRELPVVIEDLPPRELLEGHEDHLAPDLLGLFTGPSLAEASVFDSPLEPNAVYLFQRNLERVATCKEQLLDEARVTLVHEIGHYLGLEESDLDERDLV
jgi:predicted Zn-dependent protease with MMP-like domain